MVPDDDDDVALAEAAGGHIVTREVILALDLTGQVVGDRVSSSAWVGGSLQVGVKDLTSVLEERLHNALDDAGLGAVPIVWVPVLHSRLDLEDASARLQAAITTLPTESHLVAAIHEDALDRQLVVSLRRAATPVELAHLNAGQRPGLLRFQETPHATFTFQ